MLGIEKAIWPLVSAGAAMLALAPLPQSSAHLSPSHLALAQKSKASARVELTLPLGKLTEEQADEVQEALSSMYETHFECEACGFEADKSVDCPHCEEPLELVEGEMPLFDDVSVEVDKGLVQLNLSPGQTLSLSAVEGVLKPIGIRLPRKGVGVLPWSLVTLDSRKGEIDAAKVKEALGPIFKSVELGPAQAAGKQLSFLVGPLKGDKPCHLEGLEKALAAANVTVGDIQWRSPCSVCAKTGATVALCQGCWSHKPRQASYVDDEEDLDEDMDDEEDEDE